MVERDTVDLRDTFFAAIERGDLQTVGALYADDVAVWHNVTGEALDKVRSLAAVAAVFGPPR
jgi:ketosteroid isomerase-like protein